MVEKVCQVKQYFEKEYAEFKGSTTKMWSDHIQMKFRLIFRGVIHGLIYLYRMKKMCGNLANNIFVSTHTGKGRILPSMDPALDFEQKSVHMMRQNIESDVNSLVDAMTSIIAMAHEKGGHDIKNLSVDLPSELVHFFDFIRQNKLLHRVVKTNEALKLIFNSKLTNDVNAVSVSPWSSRLTGRYRKIYDWANRDGSGVKRYNSTDIARFYNAVYNHINDTMHTNDPEDEYGKQVITDEQIEKDLSVIFPYYYKVMFEIYCYCIRKRTIEIITNFQFNDSASFRTESFTTKWDLGVSKAKKV
ncbi:uncharacterized protein LOC130989607 isoform X2 [Salvia miltiorrhiza]|uniref:uncharacterized protein LOC130989607 isoform X2 n=1 Tax=Salvia miltiorrhiza TaxID=226208 RepID=UPI0025ABD74B|nr:uncharacterized protein LOC130989607 isoform X2 [Salvia miltiorrhiza]